MLCLFARRCTSIRLISKLEQMLPKKYAKLLESYISDSFFRVKQEE